jgi:hypothetical protein
MDINNLTSVYNQNPTLQGQYTLQQYLDLFGQGSSTTPTPDPDPDPTPDPDPGIPNIINQNINQYQGGSGIPSSPIGLTQDFMTATKDRQNRLTNPNKVQSFINNFTGGGQADIAEMIRTGQVDTRKTSGIPLGIGSAIGRMLPDKYYDMSLNDQVFTQSQMGYDGPTVFGENSMGNKDPFGLNVRSGFGNYGEAVAGNFNQLRDTLTKDRDGVTFNEETGMFEGLNADAVNQNTKLIRNKYLFRQKQLGVKNKLDKQIKEAQRKREAAKKEQERQQAANARNISTATQAFDNTRGQSSSDRGAAAAGMGGGSQQATSAGSSNTDRQDGGWGWADGGSVKKYFKGGIVSLRRK